MAMGRWLMVLGVAVVAGVLWAMRGVGFPD